MKLIIILPIPAITWQKLGKNSKSTYDKYSPPEHANSMFFGQIEHIEIMQEISKLQNNTIHEHNSLHVVVQTYIMTLQQHHKIWSNMYCIISLKEVDYGIISQKTVKKTNL